MFTSISLIAISDQKQGQHKLCFLVRGVSMWARAWCWAVLVTPGFKLGLRGPKHKAKLWSWRVREEMELPIRSIVCTHLSRLSLWAVVHELIPAKRTAVEHGRNQRTR